VWRAYRKASRRASELSTYAFEQAVELDRAAARLNEHGFALEHTASELFPKIQRILEFMEQPLVAAALPWVIRRVLACPYRRR
jgi:hypothetical protein